MKAIKVKPLILIVEDDENVSHFIATVLQSNEYHVIKAGRGREAISMATSYSPDLVLLDLGLPDMDGLEVLKAIREWKCLPVIVVSARGNEREKVDALDLGADDYVTKPFGLSELLARIRTALRHGENLAFATNERDNCFKSGDLEIDYDHRSVTVSGKLIHMTPIEYKIMTLLAKNVGRVLTYAFIMKDIWGPYANEIMTLRANMANIRRKIEINPGEPRHIVTEVGVGYRMIDQD